MSNRTAFPPTPLSSAKQGSGATSSRIAQPQRLRLPQASDPESVTDRGDDLSRIVVVGPGEGTVPAIQETAVRDVEHRNRQRDSLAQRLADRDIRRCVIRQMLRSVAIEEARTKVDVRIDPSLPHQSDLPADTQCVALI